VFVCSCFPPLIYWSMLSKNWTVVDFLYCVEFPSTTLQGKTICLRFVKVSNSTELYYVFNFKVNRSRLFKTIYLNWKLLVHLVSSHSSKQEKILLPLQAINLIKSIRIWICSKNRCISKTYSDLSPNSSKPSGQVILLDSKNLLLLRRLLENQFSFPIALR
jgi:hypothetical protein